MLLRKRARSFPVDVTNFVGRRRELAEIRRMLSNARLVTLTGVGGVGKTRLALRAAAELGKAFPDGVVVVELAELNDPSIVATAVAAAFGVDDDADRLLDVLAGKRVLLVLDNCEHLVDACAELAWWLLSSTVDLCVLATSRQPLGIVGEHTLAVPSLTVPEPAAVAQLAMLDQYDAVNLFVARAKAICPDFTITEDNYQLVVRLCHQLDGIPLAIELAAARLRAFSLEQILQRLGDRFRLLTEGNRIALPRQRTLRALIDWSFWLCSETERTLWSRLSVFAGGFELEAAEAVCGGDPLSPEEVVDALAALVDKSIVVRTESAARVEYRMLETVRQYGQDRLAESGAEVELRRRHRDWFTRLAKRAEAGWPGSHQVLWCERIRADTANLRLALDFCLTQPEESLAALELATALCNHRHACVSLGEGRRWLDRALVLAPSPSSVRAKGLWVSAWLALLQGDGDAAGRLLEQCREVAEQIADPSAIAHTIQFTGLARLFAGDLPGAIELLREAFDRHRALGDQASSQVSFGQLTMALCFAGHPDAATNIATSLSVIRAEAAPVSYAYILWYTAIERFIQGDATSANARAAQALRIKAATGDRWLTMLCLETLAWTAAARNDHARAARLLGAAEAARRALGSALTGLGHLRPSHQQCEISTRQALGEETYTREYRLGMSLAEEEAVAWAARPRNGVTESPRRTDRGPLTPREREIAELVAKGLSNKEIAATLVIAQRTAETHVEHILTKLGFTRRTQIAAWATEHLSRLTGGRAG